MRRLVLLAAATALASLSACSPPEPPHDIAYYRDHPEERVAKMKACQNDRGRLAATANCINALGADSEAVSKKFWTTPAKPTSRVADPGKL
jgi:hypothetical protein